MSNLIIVFLVIGVIAAGLAAVSAKASQQPVGRRVGIAVSVCWAITGGVLWLVYQQGSQIPGTELQRYEGGTTELSAKFDGRPVIVNLWATWCPPCRREMPMMSQAEQEHPEVRFVFLNQSEHRDVMSEFLRNESLDLQTILYDPESAFSSATGTHALPTTFFYSADGELRKVYAGEVTPRVLEQGMATIQE